MKYILIALLFCICYVGEGQKSDSIKSKWYDASQAKFIPSFWIDTLPTKPLNIKMKPRWNDTVRIVVPTCRLPINDSIVDILDFEDSGYLTQSQYDSFFINRDGPEFYLGDIEVPPPQLPIIDSSWHPEQDTVRSILLVSDTSSQNGYRTQRCYWMYGYGVMEKVTTQMAMSWPEPILYLDEKKRPLSKNLIVWISKQVK